MVVDCRRFLLAGLAGLIVLAAPARAQDVDPDSIPTLPPGFLNRVMPPSARDPDAGVQPGIGEVVPNRRYRHLGPTVIGPGGVVPNPQDMAPQRRVETPKPKALSPEERAEAIRKALAPKPPFAVTRRKTLDDLYGKLAKASDEAEAKGLAGIISGIWLRSGSDTAALLMQRALVAADKKDYGVSLGLLDRIIEMQPSWAEAWNKRASVRYAAGDLDGSMEDVEHVLKLEPNHFAALAGMAMILQRTGFDKRALQVYRRALAVYPHQPTIEEIVRKLSLEVEGQGI